MTEMNCSREPVKTAGLIIIGNEILSGKVQDQNSFFLATELRALGVNLLRISVIPDELNSIGSEVRTFSGLYDYVFTSGGVGPTHDDITMEGIAKGFGVNIMRHPVLAKRFLDRYGSRVNESVMKMADLPEGSDVIEFATNNFPLVVFRNIYIFPGIPRYLQEKFRLVRERFRTSVYFLKRVYLQADESDIASILNSVVEKNRCVTFGSYPILGNSEYRIIVTAESKLSEDLDTAVGELLNLLPGNVLVRVE